ncbi:7809_t:CDS:2 [Entrophospora sp. SA101]|nr:7809_t:CDS:2 [Entrophospora sp. SA101]
MRNIPHNNKWKDSNSVLVKVVDRILAVLGEIWNNPAFATRASCDEQSEGMYITDVVVPLLQIVYSEMEDPIELNEKMNSIEKYVTTVLYEKIFCPKWSDDSLKDEELNSKILALNYLNLKDLGIELNSNQQQIVELVVKLSSSELENLNQRKSPFEKLECLINCHKIINAHLILPLLIHIIIKSNPKN